MSLLARLRAYAAESFGLGSHMWNGPADKSAQQQIPHRERCSHMSGLWARS